MQLPDCCSPPAICFTFVNLPEGIMRQGGNSSSVELRAPEYRVDKPIEEWKRRLKGMAPEKLKDAWSAKAHDDWSWTNEANFHVAAADRMKQLGNMAIDLDDDVRKDLCRQAQDILSRLQKHLHSKPDHLIEIQDFVEKSDAYFEKFGSRTARYYMFEQGVIDELGDRKRVG